MAGNQVDLRSDTVTRPTAAMREAMLDAEVGDEQRGEDPTTGALQARVAGLLGKEAAVFLPSGTMCNEIALLVHCRPGDEVICDRTAHVITAEGGGSAALAGAMVRALDGEGGVYTPEQLADAVREASRYAPSSRLAVVEQTSNQGGGTIWPLDAIETVGEAVRAHGLLLHMDGARLFNAVVETGLDAARYAAPCDSVWVDFSKGLGCPVGAVLAGSAAFVEAAWQWKQRLGGAMRQSGILAAVALHALDHHVARLADDHANARRLADAVKAVDALALDQPRVDSNLVFFDCAGTGRSAADLSDALRAKGVLIGAMGRHRLRAVTHLDVDAAAVDTAGEALQAVVGGLAKGVSGVGQDLLSDDNSVQWQYVSLETHG